MDQISTSEINRIILFLPSFEKGGVERNAVYFANAMVARGFNLSVLYCRHQEEWFSHLHSSIEKIKIGQDTPIPLIHERISDAIKMIFLSPFLLFKMKNKQRLALVSFQSNIIAIIIARLLFIPVAVRLSNHYSSTANEKSMLRKLSELGKELFYKHADIVVANSSELADDYSSILKREILTIHNPIEFNFIEKLCAKIEIEPFFINKKRPIVIGAGRLSKQKNFELLIKAMAIVVNEVPCDLVILGEGSERLSLEGLVSQLGLTNHVHLIGHRNNPYMYFNRADLFVLSSNYEGMPNVLIEAIACGLPAVSTRCKSGPTEILMDGKRGLLINVNDVSGLSRAIIYALTNSKFSINKKIYSKEIISEYDEVDIHSKWFNLCSELFEKNKNF